MISKNILTEKVVFSMMGHASYLVPGPAASALENGRITLQMHVRTKVTFHRLNRCNILQKRVQQYQPSEEKQHDASSDDQTFNLVVGELHDLRKKACCIT